MRSFADEKKGTLELLLTKPLSLWQIVNGKFLGALLLIVLAIIPTFIYVSKSNLGMPEGNIDMGSTIGSYAGLMLLISILLSEFSRQPYPIIKSWLLSSPYFFVSFYFDLKDYPPYTLFSTIIAALECKTTLKAWTVIDTRDVLYFVSITILFLSFTVYNLKSFKF
jgi:ABC-2 type transport system permease protein